MIIEALILLSKLSLYELCFTNFFFPILDTVIIGNFDLSFPVYSKTTTGFKKCKEIIEENDLFIRQLEKREQQTIVMVSN